MKTAVSEFNSGVLALLAGVMICLAPVHADVADGERDFVRELLDRGWFDLASQFCERRLADLPDVNERAEWELILSECHQQHAWSMDEDSRYGLIGQSVQRITEFLDASTPSAEQDILLRVRHLELLASAGTMESVIQAPISGRLSSGQIASANLPRRARRVTTSTKFALAAATQGIAAANALLKQIDEIRRDVDSDVVRTAKERIRLSLAEMTFVMSRLGPVADSAALSLQAEEMTEQLQKSAAEDSTRFRCRVLLAEVLLEQNDADAFRLRLGTVTSSAGSTEERAQAAALKIRLLLNEGQPTEALQEYVHASEAGLTLNQELQTLRLQSLLQLLEVVSQLNESAQREAMLKSTTDEFLKLRNRTLAITSGVWRQRSRRIAEHFERVLQVGPEAAIDLEEVAVLIEQGKIKAGREILKALVQRLSDRDRKFAARVLTQSGSLSVRLGEWSEATEELQQATQYFLEADDQSGAAAADLLRVYAIGQNWHKVPASGISEKNYRDAMERHLQTFPTQPTALQVREWRARLLQTADPLGSAAELLRLAEADRSRVSGSDTVDLSRRMANLCLAGDLLLEAMSRPTPEAEPLPSYAFVEQGTVSSGDRESEPDKVSPEPDKVTLESVSADFDQEIAELIPIVDAATNESLRIMQAQQLGLQLQRPLDIQADWQSINVVARQLRRTLNESNAEPGVKIQPKDPSKNADINKDSSGGRAPSELSGSGVPSESAAGLRERALMVCDACLILSGVRRLEDSGTWEEARIALSRQTIDSRLRVIRILSRQLGSPGHVIPGDGQLAHLLIGLSVVPAGDAEKNARDHVQLLIRQLEVLQPLSVAAGSSVALDRVIGELAGMPLTESQMMETASVLTRYTEQSSGKLLPAAGRFWKTLQKRAKPGQEPWLEASLQMAMMAEKDGKRDEAVRILGVVTVLHPEWGSPARKARVEQLRERLGTSP